ncbi:MAG: hypothetical protein H8E15_13625 [Planctomycetes bacterium]|nr:hypothetical protein [Planctomycetota bacterium]
MLFLSALGLSLLLLPQQTLNPTGPPKDWIAMTSQGVQVESLGQVAKGALIVETPYGLYRTGTDPVEFSFQRSRDRTWATTLSTSSTASLLEAIAVCRDNGQISGLIEVSRAAMQRNWPDEIRVALRGLEDWGARLDPVPKGMTQDQRVDWLWQRVQEVEGPAKLLFSGRLASEVMPAANGVGDRQLTQVQLRKAIRDRDPLLHRAALHVMEVQMMADPYLGAQVQMMSLYGDVVCLDRAARSAAILRTVSAREYWVRALLRASDSLRLVAARNLALEMPEYAAKPFAIFLSAVGKLAPKKFQFADHAIQVVVDRRAPRNLLQLEVAFSSGGEMDGEYLEGASTIKICKVPETLRLLVQRHLIRLAGDDKERTTEEWLQWYKEHLL